MTQVDRLRAAGFRRVGAPATGFRYVRANGRAASARDSDRIRALKIPPAWKNVVVNRSPRGPVQAMGQDAAGRWQYRYHEARTARGGRLKFERVLRFGEALPKMRRAIGRDLVREGMPREKVLACVLRILSTCFLRPGSEVYARENGSYGIATLREKHVRVEGDLVSFDFPGKSGQRQRRSLRDRRVARIVRELAKVRGEVFKFRGEAGRWVDIRRRDINDYIKEVMGSDFSAKDFRTWAGTLICASALARAGVEAGESPAARRRKIVAAIRETSETLGNTPAVCRRSYIVPAVLTSFECGHVIDAFFEDVEELVTRRAVSLHGSEKALLRLLLGKVAR